MAKTSPSTWAAPTPRGWRRRRRVRRGTSARDLKHPRRPERARAKRMRKRRRRLCKQLFSMDHRHQMFDIMPHELQLIPLGLFLRRCPALQEQLQ
ncbi:hypothetical protein PVAP13_1KG158300 [Panicum virgatum]|uniref:Uncharacterized protein n=1 Tax=Panicum virgatum TaxID=38727 RepID=A0A8T0XIG6_PANVG|nr:hypothetical protein PVAP13_1KG158300 [Panicum virgatum]